LDTENAPAKINLALAVTGKRDDGYHLIETFVVFTEFGDRLTVEPANADSFVISGPYGDQLATPDLRANLVLHARDMLRARIIADGNSAPAVSLTLEKNLPVASGIGGGSADCAATLRLLARHWNHQLKASDVTDIGLKLGADVPMCLRSHSLMARGIGEVLESWHLAEPLYLVLANPGVAVSTPAVFKLLSCAFNPPLPALKNAPDGKSMAKWVQSARNDLAAPACSVAPEITSGLNALERSGAEVVAMSGSGATCFGLYRDSETAQQAASTLAGNHPDWFIRATRTIG